MKIYFVVSVMLTLWNSTYVMISRSVEYIEPLRKMAVLLKTEGFTEKDYVLTSDVWA
jgi:hypothetical protein